MSKQAEKTGNLKEKELKLKEILVKSFPIIRIKQMRPGKLVNEAPQNFLGFSDELPNLSLAVMHVLKNLPVIDEKYLKVLVRDKDLYQVLI
jgi:negative elongation factor B